MADGALPEHHPSTNRGRNVIGKIATSALRPVAATYLRFKRRALRRSPTFDVRAVHRADGSFDDLWNRTKHLYENTNARGSRELAWYCAVGLGGEKLLLGCYDGERLTGYMLLLADRDGDTQFLRCIDLWLDPEAAPVETTRALLRESVAIAWKRRSDSIVLPHFHRRIAEIYEALGLIRRPAWARREFISGPKKILSAMTIENTYFVGAQGDVGL